MREEKEGLVVTAQQSRFHVDATDTPSSREIDIKTFSLSINGRDLLVDAELRLKEGTHYVLVGRNGTGKSTLLRAIAEERIPGVAANIHCLLLGQTLGKTETDDAHTAIEHVVKSDGRRQRCLAERDTLAQGLASGRSEDAVRALHSVKHSRLEHDLMRAKLIAARRSGARGWDARTELNRMEKLVEESATVPINDFEMAGLEAAQLLDELETTLQLTDSSTAETRARELLSGLRFKQGQIDGPYSALSGGWRMRCELACALFQSPDVLLLDEPTNFLDLPSVVWLQRYIDTVTCTVVVVTHDRDFADNVGEELLILREQKIEVFDGNLTAYEKERDANIKRLTKMKDAQDKKVSHMEKTIQNNVNAAKRTGDDKKLRQAASRRKKIDDRMGMEVSAKGGRFKLNRDLQGYHTKSRADIEIPKDDPLVKMTFPVSSELRFPGALVSVADVSFRYKGSKSLTLANTTLTVHLGDRIGLVGANGSGKSTLVKLIVEELQPTAGTITKHPRLNIGYFSQHATDELEALSVANPELTALSHFTALVGTALNESQSRALLGGMGLPGRIASDVPIAMLSGGQRVRLALAKLVWNPPQLLILDEVTTHLDADTIVALVRTLRTFEGALLVVTHDRFFMRAVVEGESIDDDDEDDADDNEQRRAVYRLVKGKLTSIAGMSQYEASIA